MRIATHPGEVAHEPSTPAETQSLLEISELYRVTLASIGDTVITTDREGRATSLNRAAEALTAWSGAEAIGQPVRAVLRIVPGQTQGPPEDSITGYRAEESLRDPGLHFRIIHPDDRERVAAHPRDDLLHREMCELEYRILCRDGQVRWTGHACQLVVGASGEAAGRRASNRDISEYKRSEEELRARNDELTRFNRAMVDRELRMIELKKEVNELCLLARQAPRYSVDFERER